MPRGTKLRSTGPRNRIELPKDWANQTVEMEVVSENEIRIHRVQISRISDLQNKENRCTESTDSQDSDA